MKLMDLAEEVYKVSVANGWYDSDRSFGDDIALLHSEVSEMFEAYRDYGLEDATQTDECQVCKSVQKGGVMHTTGNHSFVSSNPKPEGVGSEAADILIRLLDTCKRNGIDLDAEYIVKLAYNKTRGYRHGGKRV